MSDHMEEKKRLSHVDQRGDAIMVDVGNKKVQKRSASASGLIRLSTPTLQAIRDDEIKKGNVLAVARVAGIQGAKATSSLIPLCHTIPLDAVKIDFDLQNEGVLVSCTVNCQARTGVEMEALSGTSVALLTIYDMCKAIDKTMVMEQIKLNSKHKKDLEE